MIIDRFKLPFRKNCEGYFVDKNGCVLAKETEGFLMFPGGGVDDGEKVEDAIIRETLEETGAVIKNLRKIRNLRFVWGPNWAKTEKQKKRHGEFQGEDMTFFTGEIDGFVDVAKESEDYWNGEKLIKIFDAVKIIESGAPFSKYIINYREMQLTSLKKLMIGGKND